MRLCDAQSTARVALANLAVEVVLGGIRECDEEGFTLSPRQQQIVLRNAFMAYRTHADETEAMLSVDEQITTIREGGGS